MLPSQCPGLEGSHHWLAALGTRVAERPATATLLRLDYGKRPWSTAPRDLVTPHKELVGDFHPPATDGLGRVPLPEVARLLTVFTDLACGSEWGTPNARIPGGDRRPRTMHDQLAPQLAATGVTLASSQA